jgi:hypothetical protein
LKIKTFYSCLKFELLKNAKKRKSIFGNIFPPIDTNIFWPRITSLGEVTWLSLTVMLNNFWLWITYDQSPKYYVNWRHKIMWLLWDKNFKIIWLLSNLCDFYVTNEKTLLTKRFFIYKLLKITAIQSIPFIVNGPVQQKVFTCAGYSL